MCGDRKRKERDSGMFSFFITFFYSFLCLLWLCLYFHLFSLLIFFCFFPPVFVFSFCFFLIQPRLTTTIQPLSFISCASLPLLLCDPFIQFVVVFALCSPVFFSCCASFFFSTSSKIPWTQTPQKSQFPHLVLHLSPPLPPSHLPLLPTASSALALIPFTLTPFPLLTPSPPPLPQTPPLHQLMCQPPSLNPPP